MEPRSRVVATTQTGAGMEGPVTAIAASLTIYDMCKALDKSNQIAGVALVSKTGGERGDFRRDESALRTSPLTTGSRGSYSGHKSHFSRGAG